MDHHRLVIIFTLLSHYLISQVECLDNYDFIIVGGGTGGLAVARRLAESGENSVLVLESGDWPKEDMDVPAFAPRFTTDPEVTFQYSTVPQHDAGLRSNGIIPLVSGRMLGGTSNLNFMWFNRGNPKDYDNWGNMTHDSSWNYANMMKYFRRVETYYGEFPSDQHGFSGPVSVSQPKFAPGLQEWLAAGKSLKYPVFDPNGPQQVGFAPTEFAKRHGRRDSAYTAYIQPVYSSLQNLHIILNTNVTEILFEGKRAVGVRFESESPELANIPDNCLFVNKEIVISAGTYGSPVLLMRSGIGPKDVLSAANIPIVQELPVGKSFQDHVQVPVHIIINTRRLVVDEERDFNTENWKYFLKHGDGPYSSTQGGTGQAFLVSSVAKREGEFDWPDLHITMAHSISAYYRSGIMNSTYNNASIAAWEAPMLCSVYMSRPKSRGSIKLNPVDPQGPPLIDSGFLSDSRDVEKVLDGIKEIIRIFEQTPSYRKLGARLPPVDIPMCRMFPFRTDDYWRCYIHYIIGSGCHPASSCKMGDISDPEAVVDTKLRVIGVEKLRIADASIFPAVTDANTHAAVYAVAEKASEEILKDWQIPYKS